MSWFNAAGACQREMVLLWINQINEGKRQIVAVGCQAAHAEFARFIKGPSIYGLRRQLPQQSQLTFANYALRIVAVGTNNAACTPFIIWNWAIGEGVVSFFWITITLHDEEQGFVIGAFISAHHRLGARTHLIPNFSPNLGCGLYQDLRMFPSHNGFISVVVEVNQLFTPPH